ncbi:MAG: hypothetical protein K8S55_13055, partial [Phycisphaerae bacterium]|nr:hypothetical protein [Phycisphaerae bacterium]
MSFLLEVFGRGLEYDLREVLRPFYWQDGLVFAESPAPQLHKEQTQDEKSLHLGLANWREGRLGEAEEHLSQACVANRENTPARAALACVLEECGNYPVALQQLFVLNRFCPDQPAIQFAIGLYCEKCDQPANAWGYYQRAIELDADNEPARMRLAAVALKTGLLDDSIEQYVHLCRLLPAETQLRSSLGNLYFLAENYPKAAEMFETVIAMLPDNWSLNDEQIARLIAQGEHRRAIRKTLEDIETQGPFADLYLRLANLYSMAGDDGPAVNNYLRALNIQPGYQDALVKLATHHLLFGRWEESAETFGKAAEINDRLVLNYIGMGVAQAMADKMNRAAHSFELATSIEPNSTLLQAQMIRLHWKIFVAGESPDSPIADPPQDTGQADEREILQNELQCHVEWVAQYPENALSRFNYAVLLRSSGRAIEATREFLRVSLLHPTHLPALAKLGVLLKEQDRDEFAARIFQRILRPDETRLNFYYGMAQAFHTPGGMEKLAATDEIVKNLADPREFL